MATQKCPKCKSNRIRQGYRPTSILLKVIFRYNLLCENCNWEFNGFAIPGTVPKKTKKRKNNKSAINLIDEKLRIDDSDEILGAEELIEQPVISKNNVEKPLIQAEVEFAGNGDSQKRKTRVKKKSRVKLN